MKFLFSVVFLSSAAALSGAEGGAPSVAFTVNNLWIMIAGMLVFMMHLGFATVESGLVRAKNCNNILFKNLLVPPIGMLSFAFCGFALMYPGTHWLLSGWLSSHAWGLSAPSAAAGAKFTYWTEFFFQGMFAATSATIVSGAVAERIKLNSFLIFAVVYVSFVYPVIGSWGWGGGWLDGLKFHDFAGSTFVHSVGGWGALAGCILLGPRIGKYVKGHVMPIMGHNMPLATIGVFLLWFGWYGFNGGSVLSADPEMVSYVLVTTTFGASAGIVASLLMSGIILKKPDLSMTLNGCLAGLVAVTAGADCLSISASIVVGAIGGAIVIPAVLLFDRLRLDDPVGALSVHLVNGVWGTIAVGVFCPDYTLGVQLLGVVAAGGAAFPVALGIFAVLRETVGLRVSEDEELRGLDLGEHGMEAYSGFQIFTNQ